jgi:hypothetical protein
MFYTLKFAYQKPKSVKLSFDFKDRGNSIISSIQNHAFEIWHKAALALVFSFGSIREYSLLY